MSTWDLPRLRSLRLREPGFHSSSRDAFDPRASFYPVDADCFAMFGYIPVRGIQNDDERYVNRLVLDFKEAEPSAISTIATLVQESFAEEPFWQDRTSFRGYAVAVPSSKEGVGSQGINQLLRKIAQPYGGPRREKLTLCPFLLDRFSALQTPSHQQKKSAADHLASIQVVQSVKDSNLADKLWSVDPAGPRVILFDDVYTRGETFSACRKLIQAAMTESASGYEATPYVSGFFIAKTWAKNEPLDLPF
jgi:predicted amidophosphoribosyltransferase